MTRCARRRDPGGLRIICETTQAVGVSVHVGGYPATRPQQPSLPRRLDPRVQLGRRRQPVNRERPLAQRAAGREPSLRDDALTRIETDRAVGARRPLIEALAVDRGDARDVQRYIDEYYSLDFEVVLLFPPTPPSR